MVEQGQARTSASLEDESAEWRPYQVWASRMRTDRDHATAGASQPDAGNTWDPYQVWKRHVQKADSTSSDS